MALYYNIVFGLLVTEMVFFGILSLPYPRRIRRTVLTTISLPFKNEQFQIALKCVLGFVAVLFIDSVNRVYAVTMELQTAAHGKHHGGGAVVNDRGEIQARRFYAQRNMYLCGFTLFLHLILIRTYSLVAELVAVKDKLDGLKESKGGEGEESETVKKLRSELNGKEEDLEILKGQAESLSKDYQSVSNKDGELKKK
ncbi:Endoplasmic reticulum transmembrane protein 3 [Spathaspora sp. JA1]|nr:Endoplasmic reticulum transmembrane protein 3 [Spathaspora sp. JA1]